MTEINCTVTYCTYNDGYGKCTKAEIFISDAKTGKPICEDVEN